MPGLRTGIARVTFTLALRPVLAVSAPRAIHLARFPVGMSDAAEIPARIVVAVHAKAVLADIVNLIAVMIGKRCALATGHQTG